MESKVPPLLSLDAFVVSSDLPPKFRTVLHELDPPEWDDKASVIQNYIYIYDII